MRFLLDTHVFLWWLLKDPRLSAFALSTLLDVSNDLYLSSVSGFEIATKVTIGRLKLPGDVRDFIRAGMAQGQVHELPVTLQQTYRIAELPMLHRDPFDRLLISAAIEEDMTLLTDDAEMRKYPVKVGW